MQDGSKLNRAACSSFDGFFRSYEAGVPLCDGNISISDAVLRMAAPEVCCIQQLVLKIVGARA